MKKAHDWEVLPEPHDWALKLSSGYVFDGKGFHKGANFDPAYSLSDESIRANDALSKFRQVYLGCRPADYLAREAEKLGDAARAAFVAAKLTPISETFEPTRALRAALERLGPESEVHRELAIVDEGKLVDAGQFWQRALNRFNPNAPGLGQVHDVVHAMQEEKKNEKAAKPSEHEAPKLLTFADVRGRFEALRASGALEVSLASFGVAAAAGAAGNRDALLAARHRALAELAKAKKTLKPAEIFETWLADARRRAVEHNRAAADLSLKYAALIAELRARAPRLDQEGVTRGCADFRQRVGSNALAFGIGDVNPAGTAPQERIDAAVAYSRVDGADWNPLLDKAWVEGVYQKLDPAELAQLAAKDAPAAEPKPAEAPKPAQPAARLAAVSPANSNANPNQGPSGANSNTHSTGAETGAPSNATAKKDTKQDQELPKVPRALVEPKPAELAHPPAALAKALVTAKSGQVIFEGGGGSPEQVTKSLLAHHSDAKLDAASGTLTLPTVDEGAAARAGSIEQLGHTLATETGVDKVYVELGPEEAIDAPTTVLRTSAPLPAVEKQKKQRLDVYAQINPIAKLISTKLDPKTHLLAAAVQVPTAAAGLVLTVTPEDWKHILEGHVKETFKAEARGDTPRSFVYLGSPAEYADLLEQACQNAAVARDLQNKVSPIRLKFNNQEFSLKVELATAQIKTFHATGLIANKSKFKIWSPGEPPP